MGPSKITDIPDTGSRQKNSQHRQETLTLRVKLETAL